MAVKQQVVLAPVSRTLGESSIEALIEGAVESVPKLQVGIPPAQPAQHLNTSTPQHPQPQGSDIFLDLRATTTFEPYALVMLYGLVRHLAESGQRPYLLLPEEERALATLQRAGLGPAVQCYAGNDLRLEVSRDELEAAPVLVGLQPIHGPADVEAARRSLSEARQAVRDYLGFDAGEAALLEAALVELAQNVWQHSEDWGLLCVARGVQPRTERRSLTLAVADLGVGIRNSLSQRYEVSDWTDADAIVHATKPGYSRCGEQRGIGLTQALAIARRFDGSLVIRSGAARVNFGDRRFHFVAPFPGVQIALTVRQPRTTPGRSHTP